jgi:hypothetical protein
MKQQTMSIKYMSCEPSPLFGQIVRENSTRSLEWLRAAAYMPDDGEYHYCLERALMLDPANLTARNLLEILEQIPMHHRTEPLPKASLQPWLQSLLTLPLGFLEEIRAAGRRLHQSAQPDDGARI